MSDAESTVKILSFDPLVLELPPIVGPLPLPVHIALPEISVTVRRLLSEVFDPSGTGPAVVGKLPGPGYTISGDGTVELGKLVEFIVSSSSQLAEVHRLYQVHADDYGPLMKPVL